MNGSNRSLGENIISTFRKSERINERMVDGAPKIVSAETHALITLSYIFFHRHRKRDSDLKI